jgi:CDP-paratose 2-epimerase
MSRNFLVTGGAGFIGSNYVQRLLGTRRKSDHLRQPEPGRRAAQPEMARRNLWQRRLQLVSGDVRDAALLTETAREADVIVHLAAQVAVTTSVTNPREDFEINALGTFNVLEAARLSGRNPIVFYASTNKVYGGMDDVEVEETPTRWQYKNLPFGCPESQPLDFHSPYGCSKGAGDQYVRDYGRIYGLRTVVFRQSCIYGPRQFGVEDQGWVAWFVIAAVTGRPMAIYGDGKQVRDLLHVYDLLDAYDLALEKIETASGQVYNLGGGPENTISIWTEFGPLLEKMLGKPIPVSRGDWRPWRPKSLCGRHP